MRIFKNRGDIFFSKTNKEKSAEQKFLLISLVLIIVFSLIFTFVTAVKSDFSIKKFFKPENLEATQTVTQEKVNELPQVSGKTNFLVAVHDENNLLFSVLIQTDLDNVSYKVSMLKASTVVEKRSMKDIFSSSGIKNLQTATQALMDIEIDHYISVESDKLSQIYEKFGEVNYPVISAVRYKNNRLEVPLSVRVKEGEQTLKGSQLTGLIRYYLDVENNSSLANDIILSVLSQQINEKNYENKDELFNYFIEAVETDITVRNYSLANDAIEVLSNEQAGVNVYNAPAEYNKNNKITKDSLKEVRGYFVK